MKKPVPFGATSTRRTANNPSHTRTQAVPMKSTGGAHEEATVRRPNGPKPQSLASCPSFGKMPENIGAATRKLGVDVTFADSEVRGTKWQRALRHTNDVPRKVTTTALQR